MEVKRPNRSVFATVLAIALACGDDPSGPVDDFSALSPVDGAGSVSFWTTLDWAGPGDTFHVYLGPATTTAVQIAESVSPPLELTERLSANREYVWFIELPNSGRRGPLWRFVVRNPNYEFPFAPETVVENLARAWVAHDEVGVDSALAPTFAYSPTIDEWPVEGFTREEVAENLTGLFRWPESRRAWIFDNDHRDRYVELVDEEADLWMINYPRVPYLIAYTDANTDQIVHMRLPSRVEVECSDAQAGGQFLVGPAWTTTGGDTVYKIRDFLSAYAKFTGCGHSSTSRTITRVRSWGQMIRFGGTRTDPARR